MCFRLFYTEVVYYWTGHLTSRLFSSSPQQSAERCVSTLLDLIQTKVNYVVQEAIVVIRDIFRKYPNKCVRGLGESRPAYAASRERGLH